MLALKDFRLCIFNAPGKNWINDFPELIIWFGSSSLFIAQFQDIGFLLVFGSSSLFTAQFRDIVFLLVFGSSSLFKAQTRILVQLIFGSHHYFSAKFLKLVFQYLYLKCKFLFHVLSIYSLWLITYFLIQRCGSY